ncbi:50S ribosomal protein L6 [Pyrus ussuriensis x Pyrus communis]|uniref:50S ribosomal protein L6 n=1 Tax=Pyrus ussuriensis x Pyrus communis TaxID=2448454 RepID=A0A5N5GDT4_9ROSA|nr:50S ribosomal protein L6 [Pyrus ussuriensis x Pyrus communis]
MHGLFGYISSIFSHWSCPGRDVTVVGVSKGFDKRLQLVGVGYRATLEGKILVLSLGFSHPVRMDIPDVIQVKVEENTRIIVSGYDKSAIGQFASSIRKWRRPRNRNYRLYLHYHAQFQYLYFHIKVNAEKLTRQTDLV